MPGIAGLYGRTSAAPPGDILMRLTNGMATTTPDETTYAMLGPVGMAHAGFRVESEISISQQPYQTDLGCILTFYGRLDNRPELAAELGFQHCGSVPPLPLIAAAYERWGAEMAEHLIGDFALALWDHPKRALLLVADALGRQPLYYYIAENVVAWCSRARILLTALRLPVDVNEEYAADFLTNRASVVSPYRRIEVVPGGHVLIVSPGRVELRRYWTFHDRELRYTKDEDYEEHFRTLFERAVHDRIRTAGPVFCELSGGIDSSSITCMADHLVRTEKAAGTSVETVSDIYNAKGASERDYISVVERWVGRTGLHISEDDCPIFQQLPAHFFPDFPSNSLVYLARENHVVQTMQRRGSRVLLNGIGGDQMFWSRSGAIPLADLLASGRVRQLLSTCRDWAALFRLPYAKTLWIGAVQPLLPRRVQSFIRRDTPLGEWFDPAFVRRTRLRERQLLSPDDLGFRVPSRSIQYGLYRRTMRIFALESCASVGYIDVRHPFLDRRLMQFALSLPIDQKVRLGETRSIVRRSLRGIVPDRILDRRTKGGPGEAVHRALIRQWSYLSTLAKEPRVAEYGYVDGSSLRTTLDRARHGIVTNRAILLSTISLEMWLRTLEAEPAVGGNRAVRLTAVSS